MRSAIKTYPFPTPSAPHIAYIKDKARNSGLTSLRFVGDNRILCCDFNEKKMYLAQFDDNTVKIIWIAPTIIKDGTPVQTDLLDVNKDGLAAVTNFYQGTQSFYQIQDDKILFIGELKLTNFRGCHGVRFVPGYDDLIWITYCGTKNRFIVIADYKEGKILHQIPMPEQLQDAAFLGNYVVVPARTDHITVDSVNQKDMYATIYLFRMPGDLRTTPPELIHTWKGTGHLDAMIEHGDKAYSANQYNNAIDVFTVRDERIEQLPSIGGFDMPHGLDIRHDGLMAVTNYGDNSLRFLQLAE